MKVIDLLNKIANGEIEDKRTFNIRFGNGVYRSIYYDKEEENCMCCLKNVSDDYSIYDDISFDTEIETLEEGKKIEKIKILNCDNYVKKENYETILTMQEIALDIQTLRHKLDEIIDYLEEKDNE